MNVYKRSVLVVFAAVLFAACAAGAVVAGEPQRHVVGETEIQARIDQQIDRADADREAIQALLERAEVREIAGSAGLDIKRASAAAAILSGPSLESLAAQAREVNAGLAGGDSTVVISATALIIVLLILILLLR